jgi:hypothetical protein
MTTTRRATSLAVLNPPKRQQEACRAVFRTRAFETTPQGSRTAPLAKKRYSWRDDFGPGATDARNITLGCAVHPQLCDVLQLADAAYSELHDSIYSLSTQCSSLEHMRPIACTHACQAASIFAEPDD